MHAGAGVVAIGVVVALAACNEGVGGVGLPSVARSSARSAKVVALGGASSTRTSSPGPTPRMTKFPCVDPSG